MSALPFFHIELKVLLALITALSPKKPLQPDIAFDVAQRLGFLMQRSAFLTRLGFRLALMAVEVFSGPLTGEWTRFSRLEADDRVRRFEKLYRHRVVIIYWVAKLLKSLVLVALLSDERLEKDFGNERRRWRMNRVAFRRELVAITERKEKPPVPEPLAQQAHPQGPAYLAWPESVSSNEDP